MQRLLAIESSCDETAACVMGMDGRVYSNIIASQIKTHALYGGVVPEIASRQHPGFPVRCCAASTMPRGYPMRWASRFWASTTWRAI